MSTSPPVQLLVVLSPQGSPRPDELPSPWELGPAVITNIIRDMGKSGLHRAAGFTRRYQSASGLLKDECHERWNARRLPESLRIESIRREILPFPDEQQQKEQEKPKADGKKQSRVELREQKRTAGAAIAMAAGQQSRSRSRTPGGGDTPLPPLTPIRVKLRTSERASLRAERLHEMFTDEKPEDGADDGADDGVGDGAGNGDSSGGHRIPRGCRNETIASNSSQNESQYEAWGWSQAAPQSAGGSQAPRKGSRSAMETLESYIPQSSALFPGHPCSLRHEDYNPESRGGRKLSNIPMRQLTPPFYGLANHKNQVLNLPHLRDTRMVLRTTHATSVYSPKHTPVRCARTATSMCPATMASAQTCSDDCSYDDDNSYADDSIVSSLLATAASGRLHEHTFASRKKKCGTGPLLKNAVERAYLLNRSGRDTLINLNEAPDMWFVKQAQRAARKEAHEWQRVFRYHEPKTHGGKRVFFQNALRRAIGPRMEMKPLTYDAIQEKMYMEATQLFVPPSAMRTSLAMHAHTHSLDWSEPRNTALLWPMHRFHQRILSPHGPRHFGEDESTKPMTQTTEEAPLLQQLQLAKQEHPIEVARKLAQQKLEVAMQILDLDGDGNLSQEEFRRVIGLMDSGAFGVADANHDGIVDARELLLYEEEKNLREFAFEKDKADEEKALAAAHVQAVACVVSNSSDAAAKVSAAKEIMSNLLESQSRQDFAIHTLLDETVVASAEQSHGRHDRTSNPQSASSPVRKSVLVGGGGGKGDSWDRGESEVGKERIGREIERANEL